MNGKSMWAVVAVVGVLAGTALAQAEGGKRVRRARDGDHALADLVGLSAEQREQFQALRKQHHAELKPLFEEGRSLHEKLRTALDAKTPDPAAVGAAMIAIKQHGAKMKAAREAFKGKLKAQLTPEQQQKFEAFEAARVLRHGPRNRGEGGPGDLSPLRPEGSPSSDN